MASAGSADFAFTTEQDPQKPPHKSSDTTPAPKRGVKRGFVADKTCPLGDGEGIKKGKRFCPPHHQAYENITHPLNQPGANENEVQAMHVIFGSRKDPGVPSLQKEVLDDYLAANPPDALGAKAGRRRGAPVSLCQYVQRRGSRKEKLDQANRTKMDKELFCATISSKRKWCSERAELEWNKIDSDPANFCDDNGPSWCSRRLFIPPYLLGTDFEGSVVANFNEQAVVSTSAIDNNKEDIQKVLDQCNRGLGSLAQASVAKSLERSTLPGLMPTTVTSPDKQSVLVDVMSKHGLNKGSGSADKQEATEPNAQPTPEDETMDLAVTRISKARDLKKKVGSAYFKVLKAVDAGDQGNGGAHNNWKDDALGGPEDEHQADHRDY